MYKHDSGVERLACLSAVTVLLVFVLVGCSSKPSVETGTVSGQVTHHGKPLTDAEITFTNPPLGSDGLAAIGPDGKFEIKNSLKVGEYQIQIAPPLPVMDPIKGPQQPKANPNIPRKYQTFATSGLKLTIKPGKNEFTIDLKD